MIRIASILCCFGCIASFLYAQNPPKFSSAQQTISYQLQQQKAWHLRQLPENSVLYGFEQQRVRNISYSFRFKKQQAASFNMPIVNPASLLSNQFAAPKQRLQLSSQLRQYNRQYHLWKKSSWWKDPKQGQGSVWLREFLINSKNKDIFKL